MINGGYVLQPRCFDKSEAAHLSPVTRELWFYILRNVNHKDNGKFKRGHAFFNLSDIQKDLSWFVGYRRETYSKPQLTKSLRRLREGNMIATTKETRGIIISVCNYEYYQDPKNYEGNNEGQPKETRRKSTGHTKNKNEKNDKKEPLKPMLPDWISDDSWQAFLEMRKKIKAAPTGRAIELLIKKLGDLRSEGYDPNEVINQSTMNGWKGVFPVKETANTPAKKSKQSLAIEQLLKGTSYDPSRMDRRSDIGPSRTIDITTSRLLSGGKS